jgi:hypothetical protein
MSCYRSRQDNWVVVPQVPALPLERAAQAVPGAQAVPARMAQAVAVSW